MKQFSQILTTLALFAVIDIFFLDWFAVTFDYIFLMFLVHKVVMDQMENVSTIHWQWCLFSVLSMPYLLGLVCIFALLIGQVLVETNGLHNALRHTRLWSCCAQSWSLSVIDRRRSSVDCWQLLATIVVKLFLVQRLEKNSRGNYAYVGDIRISYLFDKYSPASGGFVP